MKKHLIIIAVILFGLFYLFISCGKYPTQSDSPYGEIILSNNLKVIDNMNGIELYNVDSPRITFTFEINNYYTDSIKIGDVIIGTDLGGYVRRVTRITIYPQRLELLTEYATLADAIISGGIDTTLYLTLGTGPAKRGANFELISAAKGVSISKQGIDLSGMTLFTGITEGVNVDVKVIDGSISFNPKVEYGFGLNSKGLDQFHTFVSSTLNYNYNLEISANGKFGMIGLINLAELKHTSIQMFGTVPILEVVSLKLDIGFVVSATIDGIVLCGTKAEYEMKAGAQLKDEIWSETWTQNTSFEDVPLSWPGRGEKHIRSYVRPRISVSFYSVVGPQISIEPFTNYDAVVDDYPSWCWELNNGIEGSYSFQLHQFGYQMSNYAKNLEQRQWTIASDCENIEDMTAPSQIDDLAAGNPSSNSIRLTWTATGDDADIGKASEYDIRYLTSPIDLTNWSLATRCSSTPNPQSAGNSEEYLVTGLSPETDYYFAIRVADEVLNWSPISNIAMSTTGEVVDVIRPSAISDLFAGSSTANSITLTWTAPGDDGYNGTATQYDIRFSTEYISPYEWETYIACPDEPTPEISGSGEEYIVSNLVPNTIYYFAIKSADEVLNWSDMSNMAGAMTTAESGRGDIIGEFASPVSSYTLDLAGTGSSLWVIDHLSDTVYNVNLTDGAVINKFNFAPNEWTNLQGVAFDGTNLWIATRSNVYKVNPENGSRLGQFRYDQTIVLITGLAWGNGKLWLTGPFVNTAYEIDIDRAILDGDSDNAVTNQVSFSNNLLLRGIMYFEGGLFISSWTNSESATVYEYDPSSGNIRQQFEIKEYNQAMHNPIQGGLTTDGTYFYTGGDNLRILKIRY